MNPLCLCFYCCGTYKCTPTEAFKVSNGSQSNHPSYTDKQTHSHTHKTTTEITIQMAATCHVMMLLSLINHFNLLFQLHHTDNTHFIRLLEVCWLEAQITFYTFWRNFPMWSSAPASRSCLYGSSVFLRGIPEGSKVTPAHLIPRAGLPADLSGESPVTSYLYQSLKRRPWAGWKAVCEARTQQCIQTFERGRPEWWQFAAQNADSPIQINPSINRVFRCVYNTEVVTFRCPSQPLLFITTAGPDQEPPDDLWEVTKLCKQKIHLNFHNVFFK